MDGCQGVKPVWRGTGDGRGGPTRTNLKGVHLDRRRRRHKPRMVKADEPVAQLATRIPKELHRRLKTYCVTHDIAVMHFVVEAIEEELVHWQYRTVTIESARGRWTPR